jgi:site-specific recombinase XerD
MKIQRTHESYFLEFLKHLKDNGYSNGTLQVAHASVRSFYEMHYTPLHTRRKDYPKSTPNGTRRTTTALIIKVLEQYKPQNKSTFHALIMTLKDTGLRITDLMNLNCDIILDNWNKTIIPFTVVTEKTGYLAKTFLGSDAITALKEYIQDRRKGSKNRKPEKVTKDSPLFVNWKNRKRMTRQNGSMIIRNAFLKIGEKKMSPHSFRKKLQTDLEKAGVNPNWIDQILGHQLINSRDAYSLPTDQELLEAYKQAYEKTIKIQITKAIPQAQELLDFAEATTLEEAKQLITKGYKFEMDYEGTKLFSRKRK